MLRRKKLFILTLLVIQLLSIGVTTLNHAKAQAVATIGVKPEHFFIRASYLNETFDVNVTIKDLDSSSKLVGVQFRLKFDKTILEVVDVTEGPFLKDPRWNLYGTFWAYYVEKDGLYGPHVLVGNMIYPNTTTGEFDQTQFPEGNGTIATITFKVIRLPLDENSLLSCSLEFIENETLLFDGDGTEIIRNIQNGRVEITSSQFLRVNPTLFQALSRGELFNISVEVNNIDPRWHLIGVQFRLTYDPELIEVVDVTEGPFLKDPRWNLYGTFWAYYVEKDGLYGPHVLVGNMIYPNTTTGEFDQTQFPEGNGTIATITFKVIRGPPAIAFLEFVDTALFDPYGNRIPYNLQGGRYELINEVIPHLIIWENQTYTVVTQSNVTIIPVPMLFVQPHRMLYFNVTGHNAGVGYVNITIPKTLLYAQPSEWFVIVGGEQVTNVKVVENTTHTSLYFAFKMGTQTVYILGTSVIPEMSPSVLTLAMLITTLMGLAIVKKVWSRKREELIGWET